MIRVAVVGLGAISFEHLAKLRHVPGARVVGVCDLSPTVARAVAERFDVAPVFTDFGEMLVEARPEVVHVLTPPQSHATLAEAAIEHGAHVLVEKPIAPTWDEYRLLREVAEAHDRLLCESYTYRFAPVVLDAIDAVRGGAVGEVVAVDVSYAGIMGRAYDDPSHFAHALPGGALMNFVTHPVSVALPFMDSVETVATWRRRLGRAFPTEDELRALLAGPRTCGTISVSGRGAPPHFVVKVLGTAGLLEVDILGQSLHRQVEESGLIAPTRRAAEELRGAASWLGLTFTGRRDTYFAGLRVLLERFYAAIREGGPSPVTPEEMDAVNAAVRDVLAPENAR